MFPEHPESSLRVSKECIPVSKWVSRKFPECPESCLRVFESIEQVFTEFPSASRNVFKECLGNVLRVHPGFSQMSKECLKSVWIVTGVSRDLPQTFQSVFLVSRVFLSISWVSGEVPDSFLKSVMKSCSCWRVSKGFMHAPKAVRKLWTLSRHLLNAPVTFKHFLDTQDVVVYVYTSTTDIVRHMYTTVRQYTQGFISINIPTHLIPLNPALYFTYTPKSYRKFGVYMIRSKQSVAWSCNGEWEMLLQLEVPSNEVYLSSHYMIRHWLLTSNHIYTKLSVALGGICKV